MGTVAAQPRTTPPEWVCHAEQASVQVTEWFFQGVVKVSMGDLF